MVTVDYRHGIAILELIAFVPSLAMAGLLAWRHGFGRTAGWFFFIIFSLLRIIGNSCYLATLNDPDNDSLYAAWAVCSSIGMSPLLFGLIYNLSRVYAAPFFFLFFQAFCFRYDKLTARSLETTLSRDKPARDSGLGLSVSVD